MAAAAIHAQDASADHSPHHAESAGEMTDGEVRKIDRERGVVTLKHGGLVNLGMPAMKMGFRVADPAMLSRLSIGDKVRFRADKIEGSGQ